MADQAAAGSTAVPEAPAAPAPAAEAAAPQAAAAVSESLVAALSSKANDYLLKVNTHDKFSTEKVVRTTVQKKRTQGAGADVQWVKGETPSRLEDVIPGLVRIGKNPQSTYAFFSFATDEARQCGKAMLQQIRGKKQWLWEVEEGGEHDNKYFENRARDNINEKRKLEEQGGGGKRRRAESIHDFVEPLHHMTYEDQLKKKEKNLRNTLRDIKKHVLSVHATDRVPPPAWLPSGWEACPFEGVRPSPTVDGYRNKTEFTCGTGKDQKTPAVGFLFGKTYDACGWIESAHDVRILSQSTKKVADIFDQHLKASAQPAFDKMTKTGLWRALLVREGVVPESGTPVMLVDVQVNVGVDTEAFAAVAADMVTVFEPYTDIQKQSEQHPYIASLSLTAFTSGNNMCPSDAPSKVLLGSESIEDVALGKRFKVSPRSFFQVNSRGNDVLLQAIAEYASLNPDTVLVDLCCGTGTIGLSLADKVSKVIGIDMVQPAIEDARRNAEKNGITNAEYVCGKAEDVVDRVLGPYRDCANLIAIVDPPRGGLHNKVLRFLRGCYGLKRFVYVSCKQSSLVDNCDVLCKPRSGKLPSHPFKPVKALGVDLFPHCDQQEMVMLFERVIPQEKAEEAKAETTEKTEEKAPEEAAAEPSKASEEPAVEQA
eukprot:TRINITY_DN26798_c0_g1_i1.p1 TRINITY_DN26798_c0_g1~~TRINITY_DN26798_c0_g1_i1.p1  ORF type:complete len:654 (+),score=311.51 TRINITY_DN26798_c0_g1_i1:133-2094(+)